MAVWRFPKGVQLASGGQVTGSGDVADRLRSLIDHRALVAVAPPPFRTVPIVPSSNFMLDVVARQVEFEQRTKMTTDYKRDERDAPPAARQVLEDAAAFVPEADAIY